MARSGIGMHCGKSRLRSRDALDVVLFKAIAATINDQEHHIWPAGLEIDTWIMLHSSVLCIDHDQF